MNFGTVASPIRSSYGGSGEATVAASVCSCRFCRHRRASRLFTMGLRKSKANFAPCACWRIGETNSALDLHGGGIWVLFCAEAQDVLLCQKAALQPTRRCFQVRPPLEMMTEMDDPMVLESVLAAAVQPTWRCVQVRTPSEMRTEMDDPMVWESVLAVRAREKQKGVLENGVFENSVVESPASGAMEVTGQVVGMETSPPALTDSPVGNDMSKHGDGAQSEAAQVEELALFTKSSEVGIPSELPFESSSFLSPNSGNFNDTAGEGTGVAQKKRRNRRQNWAKDETDDLLRAVSNTPKEYTRMEQGTASDSYWDVIAKAVPGRTGHECRGRMDTLKRSFSTTKNYCDGQWKEFKQLNEKDFFKMKVSPRLTEAWYNQIRDYCPPRPKKKLKRNGAGSSSKSTGLVSDTSSLGLEPPVSPDGIDQGERALVWSLEYGVGIHQKEFVSTPCQGRSRSCDCNLNHTRLTLTRRILESKATASSVASSCHTLCLTCEKLGLAVVEPLYSPRAEWET